APNRGWPDGPTGLRVGRCRTGFDEPLNLVEGFSQTLVYALILDVVGVQRDRDSAGGAVTGDVEAAVVVVRAFGAPVQVLAGAIDLEPRLAFAFFPIDDRGDLDGLASGRLGARHGREIARHVAYVGQIVEQRLGGRVDVAGLFVVTHHGPFVLRLVGADGHAPTGTSPRQPPDSVPRVSMNSLNRSRSELTCRSSKFSAAPTFSTRPSGCQSICAVTRVVVSPSRWNVITPA